MFFKRCAIAMLSLCALTAQADTVTIRADLWYPFNGEPLAAKPGYMIELSQKIFASAGYTVDYQLMPWSRALSTVRKGDADCVVGAYASDAAGFIFPRENWGVDSIDAYVKTGDKWRYTGAQSLLTRKVATIQDYSYSPEIDTLIKQSPTAFDAAVGDDAIEKNIRKLINGRVDTLLESHTVIASRLALPQFENQLELAGHITQPLPLYIACSPANSARSKKLIEIIDTQTPLLHKSGEIEQIMKKYHLSDWNK